MRSQEKQDKAQNTHHQGAKRQQMSGRGRPVRGQARRRHTMFLRQEGVSAASLRRLARQGGVKHISRYTDDFSGHVMKSFLRSVLHDATMLTEYGRRKTVSRADVLRALQKNGVTLYI